MSFLSVFDVVSPVINKVIDLIPDPQQKLVAQQQLMKSLQDWDSQQIQVNTIEAANQSMFVSGWRPFIGWVCGSAYAYSFVLQPFLVFGFATFGHDIKFPVLGLSELSPVLIGMLGLGGMRSWEKIKGV